MSIESVRRSPRRVVPGAILLLAPLAACASLPGPGPAPAARPLGFGPNLDLLVGVRQLDEADFAPIEDQTVFGVQLDSSIPGAPLGWEVGFSYSSEDDTIGSLAFEASLLELYGGLRKDFETGSPVRPYLGAGVSLIEVDVDASSGGMGGSESDTSPGLYVHGGVRVDVSDTIHIGLDARAVLATDFEIGGIGFDADHEQLAFLIGFSL